MLGECFGSLVPSWTPPGLPSVRDGYKTARGASCLPGLAILTVIRPIPYRKHDIAKSRRWRERDQLIAIVHERYLK